VALGRDGFASASDTYERGRPSYPDGLITELGRHWGLTPGCAVADVAAGTGKLARQLSAAGAWCLAVEPSATMRAECRLACPGVEVVAGTAESLPLGRNTVDLVTVAQAFHWFDPPRTLHEMARVLRPEGAVVLVWNERETSLPWAQALDQVLVARANPPPHPPTDDMRPRFEGDPHFGSFSRWRTRHEVPMRAAEVEDMVASRSYVRVLPPDEREAVLAEVRAITAPLPEPILMPYTTSAYCARAIPGACAGACAGGAPDRRGEEATWSD
jgi:SAM-dependent methyltransferase